MDRITTTVQIFLAGDFHGFQHGAGPNRDHWPNLDLVPWSIVWWFGLSICYTFFTGLATWKKLFARHYCSSQPTSHITKNTTHNTPQNTTPSLEGEGMSRDTEWVAEDLGDPLPDLLPLHHNARWCAPGVRSVDADAAHLRDRWAAFRGGVQGLVIE